MNKTFHFSPPLSPPSLPLYISFKLTPVPPRIQEPREPRPPAGDCVDRSSQRMVTVDVGVDVCVGTGAVLTINCQTDRGNNVMFSWTRNGGALQGEMVQPNGTLVINSVQPGGGNTIVYRCVAMNAAGTSNMNTTVMIRGGKTTCTLHIHMCLAVLLLCIDLLLAS